MFVEHPDEEYENLFQLYISLYPGETVIVSSEKIHVRVSSLSKCVRLVSQHHIASRKMRNIMKI